MEGHPDSFTDADRLLVRPLVVLVEFDHQNLHLIFGLAHPFAFDSLLHVDILLTSAHGRNIFVGGCLSRTAFVGQGLLSRLHFRQLVDISDGALANERVLGCVVLDLDGARRF